MNRVLSLVILAAIGVTATSSLGQTTSPQSTVDLHGRDSQSPVSHLKSLTPAEQAEVASNLTTYRFISGELLVIIPSQISVGAGVRFPDQKVSVEAFVSADLLSMYPSGERPDNVAVGVRGRLELDPNRTGQYFLEVAGQKYLLKQEQAGAQRNRVDIGIGMRDRVGDLGVISYSVTKTNPSRNTSDTTIQGLLFRIQKNVF